MVYLPNSIKVGLCNYNLKLNSESITSLDKGIEIFSKISKKKEDKWITLAKETKKKISNNIAG
ncbi:hypothetical protein NEF87_001095 [Candidatus Lokiarchaeum ossiferum]|uniref:Uncharacterized protein n=1 Tax=Candidatus Lokiarchaeum ossiferum TaxID=2951803 RepID=A0ABY6HN33_9ARCH|nr:hypothetical protein NEF87_001095 [Candidatus Lokiarchaeum sp. B-35]